MAVGIGTVLTPVSLTVIGLAATRDASGLVLQSVLMLAVFGALCASAATFFAARSSAGALATGLTALLAQMVILLAPGHIVTISAPWSRPLAHTWMVLVMAGLWLGGAWGMRLARRGGHVQGRLAFRLTQSDKEVGTTPTPPPSRRRDHLASLPWVLGSLVLTAAILSRYYRIAVSPGVHLSLVTTASILAALALLVAAGASVGRSTLGARVTGLLLVLVSLPPLISTAVAERWPVHHLLPRGPGPVVTAAIGLTLLVLGWGGHAARRQARTRELDALRASHQEP
ncbi:hypothetical protein D4740_03350 [Actinomyces sp. 2119]|uniref:Uncharacterized protein n=1 Tax=Actinomyces lilanjuaniae TaxID=2321394 RepID=A0ABM6Z6T5_9ACTO|nr:hypothetical protein D5R93_12150 [Actinomyces lilanjuaniae]RJF44109.1 hypothetical protein D4740_03350 [Actinomyces sp. 2119]